MNQTVSFFSSYYPQQHKNSVISSPVLRNNKNFYISQALQNNGYDKNNISKVSSNLHPQTIDTNHQNL